MFLVKKKKHLHLVCHWKIMWEVERSVVLFSYMINWINTGKRTAQLDVRLFLPNNAHLTVAGRLWGLKAGRKKIAIQKGTYQSSISDLIWWFACRPIREKEFPRDNKERIELQHKRDAFQSQNDSFKLIFTIYWLRQDNFACLPSTLLQPGALCQRQGCHPPHHTAHSAVAQLYSAAI